MHMVVPCLLTLLVIAVVAAGVARAHKSQRRGRAFGIAAALGVVSLVAFYSLAVHMHLQLDGWPRTIGNRGLPSAVLAHADVAYGCFGVLLLSCMFGLPVAVLVSGLVPRFRAALPYVLTFGASCLLCVAAMSLAPAPFVYWWWD